MPSIVVLCVDNDTTMLSSLRMLLSNTLCPEISVEIAESGLEALEITEELTSEGRELAVVISDFIMPNMRGDELLVRLHEKNPHTINIMLTGQSDLEGVKRVINEANLYRFLEKPFNNADLALTAKSAVHAYRQTVELERHKAELERINRDLEKTIALRTAELREKNRQLEILSISDQLTGLYNRLRLDQVLSDEQTRFARSSAALSLIIIDIDHFKAVNDTHGHLAGDQVLIAVARLLQQESRELDVVGRWGGEEFLVICRETDLHGAGILAEKLCDQLGLISLPVIGTTSASFGVASLRANESIDKLLARADAALYRAKHKGRNRVEVEA